MRIHFGRHVFGLAAILFGILTLVWQDFTVWQQIRGLAPHREILACVAYVAAAIEILGGLAIQWRRTERVGAIALGTIFLVFALLTIPGIFAEPRVYASWGNFFEQFSQAVGALVVFAAAGRSNSGRSSRTGRIACMLFGMCVMSFAVEQIVYLRPTANLVPKWIPPGQVFWAIATTIAFALAAIALLSGRAALFASRLLTAMLVGFGLLVWLPACFADPHKLFKWTETAETFAIAGAAWIVADYLSQKQLHG
jgi:hypothetical protein